MAKTAAPKTGLVAFGRALLQNLNYQLRVLFKFSHLSFYPNNFGEYLFITTPSITDPSFVGRVRQAKKFSTRRWENLKILWRIMSVFERIQLKNENWWL